MNEGTYSAYKCDWSSEAMRTNGKTCSKTHASTLSGDQMLWQIYKKNSSNNSLLNYMSWRILLSTSPVLSTSKIWLHQQEKHTDDDHIFVQLWRGTITFRGLTPNLDVELFLSQPHLSGTLYRLTLRILSTRTHMISQVKTIWLYQYNHGWVKFDPAWPSEVQIEI